MSKNPVGWFEIYVDDMSRAKAFYEQVLATTLENLSDPNDDSIEMWTFTCTSFEQYGATGALVKMEGFSAGNNSTLVYFSCEDCATEEARVEQAGGTVEKSKFAIGDHGFIALAKDTEGNMFGLHSEQ